MARARKTLATAAVIEKANTMLRESPASSREIRIGIAGLLESLLHDADAYAGFQYLGSAGVNYDGIERGEEFYCEDDTRRMYYTKAAIQ